MSTAMQEFFAGGARGLVQAQEALDHAGREALDGWDETGVPPSVFMWSTCKLWFPVSLSLEAKTSARERTEARLEPRSRSLGRITFSFRYIPTPQEEPA